jgi:hypothetical protein
MEFITRITNLIPVERIYLSRFEYKETGFKELTILIPNSGKMHITEARPLVNMVMAENAGYRFRLFYLHEVKQALIKGSIVFYTICKEENLVYHLAGSNFVLVLPNLTPKAVLNKVKRNFTKELKKIAGFREGAEFYIRQENCQLAALMLRQVIELSYRTAELIIIGRDKISHSVRNHQQYIQLYIPEMSVIFNQQDEEEMKLLDLLDDAYRSVRYENSYQIKQEQILAFNSKADLIGEQLTKLHQVVVEQFKQELLYVNSPKIAIVNDA